MTYPIGGQFNIRSCYVPYSTLGTSYGNPYQSSVFGGCSTSSSSGMDMSSMMSFMMQMKQLEAMNQTTTETSNSIATSTASSSGVDSTEVGTFETDGEDLEAFRDFMNNQNTASTLYINTELSTFANNLIESLNEDADLYSDAGEAGEQKISLSRALNALGITLPPNQTDMLAYSLGIDPDQDLSAEGLTKVLKALGFQAGENNRYNLSFAMEKAVKKISSTTNYKIQGYTNSSSGDNAKLMDSDEFSTVFGMFREDAPENAKLNYGSLDNLADQLLMAAAKTGRTAQDTPEGSSTTLDNLLKELGIDADTMSDQEKNELLYKAGVFEVVDGTSTSDNSVKKQRTTLAGGKKPDGYNGADQWLNYGAGIGGTALVGVGGGLALSAMGVAAAVAWPIAIVAGVAVAGVAIYNGVRQDQLEDNAATYQSLFYNYTQKNNLGTSGLSGVKIKADDKINNLKTDDVKKILVALGFGEKSVTKSELNQALEKDITFTRANITDKAGSNLFTEFLNNLVKGGAQQRNAQAAEDSNKAEKTTNNITQINGLVNRILASDDTVQQAAIEAFFTDFPDFVSEFIERAIDTTADQYDDNVPHNVAVIQMFFQGAQDLINATKDPDKKARFKIAYNDGLSQLAQFQNSEALTLAKTNLASVIQENMKYKGNDLTDNSSGYAS